METTNFFFTCTVDLMHHPFPEYAKEAMYTVHNACRAVDNLSKYGSSIETIVAGVILQDHPSKFFKPSIRYYRKKKTISAGVKVDLDKLMQADFPGAVQLYLEVIDHMLDTVKDRVEDFDFARLQQDLQAAVREEMEVAG